MRQYPPKLSAILFLLAMLCCNARPAQAQSAAGSAQSASGSSAAAGSPSGSSQPSIEARTRSMKAFPGYFNFYWDEQTGKIWMTIDKFDKDILYQTALPAGLGSNDIGMDRGQMGPGGIVRFIRSGNKVLMIQPNFAYRAVSNDPSERRAVEQSFAQSTLWGFTIAAESGGAVLVDATDLLLSDVLRISSRLKSANQGTYKLDPSRSALYLPRTKNFPLNTEFEATLTFVCTEGRPGAWLSSVTPASEAVTLRVHQSFVQLPDSNYQPRVSDPRAGYFINSYFDYSTPVSEPIDKHFIARHRLQKKDPTAAVSDPVKPIVYYLDNGTPEPIRSALLEGARWWSAAFLAAGFSNAFRVEVLPDSADPMDLRYNMINWVHRSTRGWSYGASIVDPRTGEIIKGNVTLGSLRVRQDYLIVQGLLAPFENGNIPANDPMLKVALQRLKHLAAHEVGHTLGLMHNYIASSQGRASVMDYPHPLWTLGQDGNINTDDAYTNQIGDWDKVAITYGYAQFAPGTDEHAALDKVITDAAARGLNFISDRDARDPGGLHPNAHLWDNGKDPVTGLRDLMQIRAKSMSRFGQNNIRKGTPFALLEDVLVPVYLMHRYQLEAVTKEVGGQYYTYAVRGDGQVITRPLSREEQLHALSAVADCTEPGYLALSDQIIRLLPPRPAEFECNRELFNHRTGLGFDPLGAAETGTDLAYGFLFNTDRLNRMAQYPAENGGLGIGEMIDTLIRRTWKAPHLQGLPELIRRQNGQLLLTYLLAVSVDEKASFATRAAILAAIDGLKTSLQADLSKAKDLKPGGKSDPAETGNYLLALDRMKDPAKAKDMVKPIVIPPGAPIGSCDMDQEAD